MAEKVSELHKLKRQNTIMTTEKAVPEFRGENAMDIEAREALYQSEAGNIEQEAAEAFQNFWGLDSEEGYSQLRATSKRYEIETDNGQWETEREDKAKVISELASMAQMSNTRTEKSRKKHVKKAGKAYKKAAKSFRKLGNKGENGSIGYISNAEDSIEQMIEGEIELVKAEGLKDNSEKYRLSRLELKKISMLENLYRKALENQNLSQKNRRKLNRKLQDLTMEKNRKKTQFLPVLVDQAIDWRTADTFTDNLVMNGEQFEKFVKKLNDGNIPKDVKELQMLLNAYHKNQELVGQDNEHSDVVSLNSMKIVTDKCMTLKVTYRRNANIRRALDVIYTQCQRQTEYLKDRIYKEGKKIEKNSEDREEGDYVADDEFAQYKVMSNKDYILEVKKNPFNKSYDHDIKNEEGEIKDREEYDSYDSKTSLYGKRMKYSDEVFGDQNFAPQLVNVNSEYGYIATANGAIINKYVRDKKAGINAYRAYLVNKALGKNVDDDSSIDEDENNESLLNEEVKEEINEELDKGFFEKEKDDDNDILFDEEKSQKIKLNQSLSDDDSEIDDQDQIADKVKKSDKYESLTEEQAKELLDESEAEEIEERVEKWEQETNKTIDRMDKATKMNTLNNDTRFYRMVDEGFLQYALKLPASKNVEKNVKGINRKAGTVVQDKAFMSTGFKADDYFFSGSKGQPVMLTLLADKGTKCFVTANSGEGEVIFGRGTKYMILGAYAHGKDGKRVPITSFEAGGFVGEDLDPIDDETEEEALKRNMNHESIKNKTSVFKGIEIVAKIIKEDNAA